MTDFQKWFYAAPHRAKYTNDTPAYLAAKEAWDCQQAAIDRLMLEFCPDEMTPEQLEEWEKHQRVVPKSDPQHPSNIFRKE